MRQSGNLPKQAGAISPGSNANHRQQKNPDDLVSSGLYSRILSGGDYLRLFAVPPVQRRCVGCNVTASQYRPV